MNAIRTGFVCLLLLGCGCRGAGRPSAPAEVSVVERPAWLLLLPDGSDEPDDSVRIWWNKDSMVVNDSTRLMSNFAVNDVRVMANDYMAYVVSGEHRVRQPLPNNVELLADPVHYVSSADDSLYQEVLSVALDNNGTHVAERRDRSATDLAKPGCDGEGKPEVVYAERRLERLSPYALGFLRYHELAHYVLGHRLCPSGGTYGTRSERQADSLAVFKLVPDELVWGYVGAYAQYLFREDGTKNDNYYEPDRARARYLVRFVKAANRGQ